MSPGTVATTLVLSFICLATTASNILVFVAVGYSRNLRTVSNTFIVSLSIADILLATVVMIPATLNQVYGHWVLAQGFCSIWASFDVMLCSASVLNVCAISFDRYLAIISPLRYKALMTFRRALLLLAVLWIVAILSSFVPITNGWHNPDVPSLVNLTMFTSEAQCLLIVSLPYALLAGTITIMLPIIIALVLYFKVSEEARRQALFVRTLIAPSRVLLGQDVSSKSVREPFTRKATVTLGVIVGAYVVTWTPFLITNIVDAACTCVPPKLFTAFVWLGYCNSLINPIIYPLLMRDFRKVYMKLLLICCPRLKFLKKKSKEVLQKDIEKAFVNGHSQSNGIKSDSV
ncbi:5-hydroxytryptamine receptor 6 [Aplysia californica]|uniref:5-hydroxytryptamine receptor 6 n=1 Tax=Aplysia californica TaxID=6500 RepID=A0ABM0K0D2_APLCA|nr:5-hydroxytryptamine receptor 6 [Aplysia californica]